MVVSWNKLAVFQRANVAITAPWFVVVESLGGATHLKIEVTGEWQVVGSSLPACEPDGLPGISLADDELLLAGCRFGALIGKLGGSSASHQAVKTPGTLGADEPFAVGAFCLFTVPTTTIGPLFVGFNTVSRPVRVTDLQVTVSGARPTTP